LTNGPDSGDLRRPGAARPWELSTCPGHRLANAVADPLDGVSEGLTSGADRVAEPLGSSTRALDGSSRPRGRSRDDPFRGSCDPTGSLRGATQRTANGVRRAAYGTASGICHATKRATNGMGHAANYAAGGVGHTTKRATSCVGHAPSYAAGHLSHPACAAGASCRGVSSR
jgi:hypothetical protein